MKRSPIIGAAVFSAAALVFAAGAAHAQPASAKCAAAKIKCVNKKTDGLLKCHVKSETKGVVPNDADCVTKVLAKFSGSATGCMEKAEAKPPCITTGDAATLEAQVDAFVLDVVTELDPGYPGNTPGFINKCSAGKKKCVDKKMKALLKCYEKAAKAGVIVDVACITKAQDKFKRPDDLTKGCFEKLEAKYPNTLPLAEQCPTYDDTDALENKVDAFALEINNALPSATLDFTVDTGSGDCGDVNAAGSVFIKNLSIGGLNIGGGGAVVAEGLVPDGATNRWNAICTGTTCGLTANSSAPAANTAAPDCTDTGCNFGAPLPIPNVAIPGLTTCVLNTFATPSVGTIDTTAGSTTNLLVNLSSDVYLTGNLGQPCPVCSATGSPSTPGVGTCDRGPNATGACTSINSDGLSRDCPTGGVGPGLPCTPGGGPCVDGSHVGAIGVNLSPLTTAVASDSDAGGIFCPSQTSAGCFQQATCREFSANGAPFGPINPSTLSATGRLVSAFCIPATGNGLVDASAALPGPGEVCLAGKMLRQ